MKIMYCAFVALLLVGCAKNHKNAGNERSNVLSVSQNDIANKRILEISFKLGSMYSELSTSDDMYATINIRRPHTVTTRRYKLENNQGEYSGQAALDSDAYYYSVSIGGHEQVMGTTDYYSVVYDDDVPKKNGLAYMMYSSDSEEEIKKLFALDSKYHPTATARYIPFLIYGASTGQRRSEFKQRVNVLLQSNVRDYNDRLILYSACVAGSFFMGDYNAAKEAMEKLSKEYQSGTQLPTPLTNSLANIMQSTIGQKIADSKFAVDYKLTIQMAIKMIVDSEHIGLTALIYRLRTLFPSDIVARLLNEATYADQLSKSIVELKHSDAIGAVGLMHYLCSELILLRNYASVLAIIDKHEMAILDACNWIQSDPNMPVTSYPNYGMESALRLQQAVALMKTGRESEGIEVYRDLVLRKAREEYLYAMDSACSALISCYISSGEKDSVEKYVAYSLILNSPSSNILYEKYVKSLSTGQTPKAIGDLVAKYHRPELLISRSCPHVVIEHGGKRTDIGSKHSGINIMLFSSKECSICAEVITDVLPYAIKKKSREATLVLFSDFTDSELRFLTSCDSNDYIRMDIQHIAVKALGVSGYPSIVIVNNGEIVYQGVIGKETGIAMIDMALGP